MKIVVIGSANTDMILKVPRIPKSGETLLGGTFSTAAGGKGANQAVAAARAGGEVTFIARVGKDMFGKMVIEGFKRDGINVDHVHITKNTPSGVAVIFVDERGENSIGVASGANSCLLPEDIIEAKGVIESADILLMQLETPIETVEVAATIAHAQGIPVILNPAPAQKLPESLFPLISVLTPNERETAYLTGMQMNIEDFETASLAGEILQKKGIETVILTLGSRGAVLVGPDKSLHMPTYQVKAVDTTAAGDVFNGALAVRLAEKASLSEAVQFANAAATLSVTKLGAQPSAPMRREIEQFLTNHT